MNVEVTKHKVIISKDSEPTHENEYKITECNFTYDEYIESFHVKRAIFTILSTGEKYETDIINNKCYIPYEVLTHEFETVKLGVYAFNIDEDGETPVLGNRVSPSHALFVVNAGSYLEGAVSPKIITPSQYDLYSDALQEGLDRVDEKLDEIVETVDEKLEEVDDKLDVVDEKLDDMDTAIEECNEATERTNNLNLDVSDKINGDVTVTLTKKDLTTKTVVLSDGTSLMFNWDGTKLGIKTDKDSEYVYVDLQGQQGPIGPQGNPFQIKKTYATIQAMINDYDNMEINDYVMISGNIEQEDNAKLFTKTEVEDPTYRWQYLADFSGATGIQGPPGPTPNIQIGSVTSGLSPSVTRTGTDENPIFNFVLQKGDTGEQGIQGETGNGIASIQKTGTSGLVDTYTITYTDGTTSTFTITNGEDGEVSQKQLDRVAMVYNLIPTVDDTDENITLNKTGEAPLKIDLKGNTYQEVVTTETGTEVEETSIYITDVDNTKEDYITLKGNTYQYSTNGYQIIHQPNNESTVEKNSLIFKSFPNGNLSVVGTASSNTQMFLNISTGEFQTNNPSNFLEAGTYSIKYTEIFGNMSFNIRLRQGTTDIISAMQEGTNTFTLAEDISNFNIYFYTTHDVTRNTTFNLILEKGSTSHDWEKYSGENLSPNPDYPQDIQVVKGDNTIKVVGKNLFDFNKTYYKRFSNTTFTTQNNVLTLTNNKTDANTFVWFNIPIDISKNITISYDSLVETTVSQNNVLQYNFSSSKIIEYDSNILSTLATRIDKTDKYATVTPTDKYLILIFRVANANSFTISNIMIEYSNSKTNYEAYQEQSYQINLGNIELYKIGTHFDYFYKSMNKWFLHKETAKGIFNGTENWEVSQHYTGSFYIDGNNGVIQPTYAYSQLYCDKFKRANINSSTQLSNFEPYTCYMALASGGMEFWYDDGTSSLQDFKDYLSSNNMYVYYILSTTTDTEITDTTLKAQLNALYTAQLNSGINNINTETNNLLPYINLKYNTSSVKPTPEHPSEIVTVTGNNTITITNDDSTQSQNYPINLGSMELCKIGNYQDYIYKSNDKWYKHSELGKQIFVGSNDENWTSQTTSTSGYSRFMSTYIASLIKHTSSTSVAFDGYCNMLKPISSDDTFTLVNGIACATSGNIIVYYDAIKQYTLNQFKDWLLTNNLILYYQLETPTNEEITEPTLINQLEDLYNNAISYNTQTNITQTNYKEPFIITATAFENVKNYVDDSITNAIGNALGGSY